MDEIAIKIDNVSKEYRLGAIGGGTLKGDLQSLWARIRKKEDPNSKIGSDTNIEIGERFLALDGISFEVKKGEAVGIIGHNGAGKSTLLKLLSRVTAPTKGAIGYNGRIASMLEVGTGFHPELTGRENVYMNGAILGMTKDEIDKKFDEIVEFAEMKQFIDTPVKRYSSGMYVKLAFSVAAHLDSEIMIMDEVLAVGDINFQQKCLKKMRSVAEEEGRTVLYVSHNMSTIKTLCNRCIVLEKGKLIYEGDVDEAIRMYESGKNIERKLVYDVASNERIKGLTDLFHLNKIISKKSTIKMGEPLIFNLEIKSKMNTDNAILRFVLFNSLGNPIGMTYSELYSLKTGENTIAFELDTKELCPGNYIVDFVLCEYDGNIQLRHDAVGQVFSFFVEESEYLYNAKWNSQSWGNYILPEINLHNDIKKG